MHINPIKIQLLYSEMRNKCKVIRTHWMWRWSNIFFYALLAKNRLEILLYQNDKFLMKDFDTFAEHFVVKPSMLLTWCLDTYLDEQLHILYLLGTPETNFKGLSTRIARRVRKSTPLPASSSPSFIRLLAFGSDSGSGVKIVM